MHVRSGAIAGATATPARQPCDCNAGVGQAAATAIPSLDWPLHHQPIRTTYPPSCFDKSRIKTDAYVRFFAPYSMASNVSRVRAGRYPPRRISEHVKHRRWPMHSGALIASTTLRAALRSLLGRAGKRIDGPRTTHPLQAVQALSESPKILSRCLRLPVSTGPRICGGVHKFTGSPQTRVIYCRST
jgi:hypothetical protein